MSPDASWILCLRCSMYYVDSAVCLVEISNDHFYGFSFVFYVCSFMVDGYIWSMEGNREQDVFVAIHELGIL